MTLPAAETLEVRVEDVSGLNGEIEQDRLRLIDCRELDEWNFNRLPQARHAPLSDFVRFGAGLVELGKPVIVYCHHGIRSMQAVRWLRARGLENAWSMTGGIDAWSDRIDLSVPKY